MESIATVPIAAVISSIGQFVDVLGVLLITTAVVYATWHFVLGKSEPNTSRYKVYRQTLGKGILLGLEILVAGDIIRTVAVAPTMRTVLVLAVIVAIRTFLSISLEVELNGRLPWSAPKAETD